MNPFLKWTLIGAGTAVITIIVIKVAGVFLAGAVVGTAATVAAEAVK